MVGLTFKKFDLHIHTPASHDFDEELEPQDIVDKAIEEGLDAIAITDHNTGLWIDKVKEAAKDTDLVVFPGVEITCHGGKQGIHLIAIFDTDKDSEHVSHLLSNLGISKSKQGDPQALVNKTISLIQVIDIIQNDQWQGIAIPAHVNSSKGVLKDMASQQRIDVIQHPSLIALEVTDANKPAGERSSDFLNGNDPHYKRKIATYQASDNPRGEGKEGHCLEGIGSRYSYFKLEKIDLDGLYQCFMDSDVRIRQDFENLPEPCPMIKKIEIVGGFFDGQKIEFHDGLNSILGAKGSGKSLLVELTRFGLGQPPAQPEILEDHMGKLSNRLGNYSYVMTTFSDTNGEEFTVKRTYAPLDDSPFEVEYDPAQVMPVLFLSQNEIIRIAEDGDEQLGFIDQFFDFRQYNTRIKRIERQLVQLDKKMADGIRSLAKIEELEEQINTTNVEIAKIDKKLKSEVFEEYNLARGKWQILQLQENQFDSLEKTVKSAQKQVSSVEISPLPNELANDPALRRNQDELSKARILIEDQIREVVKRLGEYQKQISGERQQWQPSFDETKRKYQEHIRKVGGDHTALASERERKVKYVETLSAELEEHKKNQEFLRDIANQRDVLLDDLEKVYSGYTEERRNRLKKFQDSSEGKLQLKILGSSNVDKFRQRLLDLKQGSYLRDNEIDAICKNIKPRDFIRALLRYSYAVYQRLQEPHQTLKEVAKKAEIPIDRMVKLATFLTEAIDPSQLLELQYQAAPEDIPEILFNIGSENFRPLKEVSIGQKSTALLIMALSDGTMPIVIDQPEDSLDIRSIWEDICVKLRIGKDSRQFIFTTHNSSVAVASDSDYFVILEASADKATVIHSGSMDHKPVSEEVLAYLEGGVETYRRKYTKYRAERRLNKLN